MNSQTIDKRCIKDEEYRLIEASQSNGKNAMVARNKLVATNLSLVKKVVDHYSSEDNVITYDDLFQEGCIGLIEAINRFEET